MNTAGLHGELIRLRNKLERQTKAIEQTKASIELFERELQRAEKNEAKGEKK